jgi:hypothetical protein
VSCSLLQGRINASYSPKGALMAGQLQVDVPDDATLDDQREASMADEGGASGAVMESEDPEQIPPLFRDPGHSAHRAGRRWRTAFTIGVAAGLAIGLWTYRRR